MRHLVLFLVIIIYGGDDAAVLAASRTQAPQQVKETWLHREFDGVAYQDMTWNAPNNRWEGSHPYCLIGDGWMHPDVGEAALGWVAPTSGTVTIRGYIERQQKEGDGTVARIMKNGTQIWPSTGQQDVPPRFMVQHVLLASVQPGDVINFHVGQKSNATADTTLWRPSVTYDLVPPKYLTDGALFVMEPPDLANMGMTLFDSPATTLGPVSGTQNVWFHSWLTHTIFSGPLDDPAKTLLADRTDSQLFTGLVPNGPQGHPWFTNIYRHTDGSYLAFLHQESVLRPSNGTNDGMRLSLAYSTDPLNYWTYLGPIVAPFTDPSQNSFNIMGTPYIIKDGYFYVYFRDWVNQPPWGHVAVARALVSDVMAAAADPQGGHNVTWNKKFSGMWTCTALDTNCTTDDLNLPTFHVTSDSAWSSTKNTYVLTGINEGPERGVWMAFSQDGLTWTSPSWVQRGTAGDCATQQLSCTLSPHQTIVAEDGTDTSVVGDSFWLYWAFTPNWSDWSPPSPPNPGCTVANCGLNWLVRQRITLTGS